MIDKLREINDKLINICDDSEKKKYVLIKQILEDDKCFMKMSIEYAYSILRDLKVEEKNLKKVYMSLIDIKEMS